MLIRFEATNFRSIADTIELSMVAVDREREGAREAPLLEESLLTVAAVYGPNASGKSNVIAALAWVCNAVRQSVRFWDDGIPLEPFAFGDGISKPSEFTVEAAIRGVRFEYILAVDRDGVGYEGLFHYPQRKRRRIFERENSELRFQRGLGSLAGTRELLTGKTLALSIARRFDEPLVSDFANALLRIQTHMPVSARQGRFALALRSGYAFSNTMRWFEEGNHQPTLFPESNNEEAILGGRERALALLRLADLGIEDVVLDEQEISFPNSSEVRTQPRLRLLHKAAGQSTPLDFIAESEGTKAWFRLIGPVLTALQEGSVVLFDELDASLHPALSAELIRLFHSHATNPYGSQLLFTSHDTSLLNHLNRDEVWLTEKREDGSTRLGALAEFAGERVRKSRNLENAYLHGRFGAIPQVDQTGLLRALGLIG